jgi:cytoskeleton protein RodZ
MDSALFGSRLRLARERRQLTLRDLEARTKLHISLFETLEEGTCRGWPVGVYSRSHIRTYAELVGLDADDVVEEFSTLFPHLAWSEQDQAADVIAALRPAATRTRTGQIVAPLRLALAEPPPPYWRALLGRFAWFLHRLATGSAAVPSEVTEEPEMTGEDAETDPAALVPLRGLQID